MRPIEYDIDGTVTIRLLANGKWSIRKEVVWAGEFDYWNGENWHSFEIKEFATPEEAFAEWEAAIKLTGKS